MNCCCPSEPLVNPSLKAKNYAVRLKILMFCEMVLSALFFTCKMWMPGIFELLSCWILFIAYKSFNFCMLIFYFILVMFNFFRIFVVVGIVIQLAIAGEDASAKDKIFPMDGYAIYALVVYSMAILFYLIAMTYAFISYREFKALMYEQQGGGGGAGGGGALGMGGGGAMGMGMGGGGAMPAPGSQSTIYIYIYIYIYIGYQPPPRDPEEGRGGHSRPPNTTGGGYTAYSGQGTRLG